MRKLLLTSLVLLLAPWAWSASVTNGVTYANSANNTTHTTASFTPANGDLLVVWAHGTGSASASVTPSCSSSVGITFTVIVEMEQVAGSTSFFCVANSLSDGSSTTVSASWTGDATTGGMVFVGRVSGMTNTGSSAVAQYKVGTSGSPPSVTFDAAPDSANPILAYMIDPDDSTPGAGQPSGYTEHADTGFTTPTEGGEWASLNSGGSTTVTWASSSGSDFGFVVELEPGGGGGPTCAHTLPLLGAGCS